MLILSLQLHPFSVKNIQTGSTGDMWYRLYSLSKGEQDS